MTNSRGSWVHSKKYKFQRMNLNMLTKLCQKFLNFLFKKKKIINNCIDELSYIIQEKNHNLFFFFFKYII